MGPPDKNFLWPMDLCTSPDVAGFGYIMPLREKRYKSIIDWMYRRVNPSFRSLLTVGYELSNSFFNLHAMGTCYRDINFGNMFFDPPTGDIAICDNDNVSVDSKTSSLVLGTPDFMAPEIVRREVQPSIDTDLFSLAVLLFYIFFISHPLYGRRILSIRCLDGAAKNQLCGKSPLFIFDPVDKSNEAVPFSEDKLGEAGGNALEFWNIYPSFFKDLFMRSFTDGLRNKNKRVRESEWREAMIKLRDSIFICPHCKVENFYSPQSCRLVVGKEVQQCWHCKNEINTPTKLKLITPNKAGKSMVVLSPGTKLYPHHLDDNCTHDFSHPLADVIVHPSNPSIVGIRNMNGEVWTATTPDGKQKVITTGKVLPVVSGLSINFGKMNGEIP